MFRNLNSTNIPIDNKNNFNNSNNTNGTIVNEENTKETIIFYFHLVWIIFVILHIIYFIFVLIKKHCCKKKENLVEIGPDGESKELRKINDDCAICINNITDEVQLLCSHSFCAKCLIDYGNHSFNMENILCPICRGSSKILVANFPRTEENKINYDIILNYNHNFSYKFSTSLCFCLDIYRFAIYYLKQILNVNNHRFSQHRIFIFAIFLFTVLYFLFMFTKEVDEILELFEEVFYYLCLIFMLVEYCYRNFRMRNNQEYEAYITNSVSDSNLEQMD